MKKLIFIILSVSLVFSGCHQKELDQLKQENAQLKQVNEKKDSTINDLIASFNQIQDNLSVIKEKESVISKKAQGDVEEGNTREQISQDIQTINDLMAQNRQQIKTLNNKLRHSNVKIAEFQKLMDNVNQQIKEKDSEIGSLKEKLVNLNFAVDKLNATVDTLTMANQEKKTIITEQDTKLNTAWYAYGTDKELKAEGIITKEGGFIGLGKVEKLVQDFNKEYFTKIDIRDVTSIPLYVKKAKLITTHPEGSYEFKEKDGSIESLEIKDPTAFWKVSKFLVIVVD
ncbi:MAG TPA: hypothetical protein VE912_24510 [Bacteroidales bacterium]|nr:hypothetical protein [Bacteroidales bacterium]